MPFFSIITINLNNATGLKSTIESIVSQSFTDYEYIVIDGASTDGSVEVIRNYESKINYWISEQDNGIYNAMNKGAAKASGKYLLFLNSGDVLAVESVLQKVALHNIKEDIVYGDILFSDHKNKRHVRQPEKLAIIYMIRGTVFHPTAFIRKSLFKSSNGYDESFKIAGDYDFFVKIIIKKKTSYRHLNITISIFDTTGVSNRNKKVEAKERAIIHKKYFTQKQLNDAQNYSKLINSFSYRIVNFIERKIRLTSLTNKFFKINYY